MREKQIFFLRRGIESQLRTRTEATGHDSDDNDKLNDNLNDKHEYHKTTFGELRGHHDTRRNDLGVRGNF